MGTSGGLSVHWETFMGFRPVRVAFLWVCVPVPMQSWGCENATFLFDCFLLCVAVGCCYCSWFRVRNELCNLVAIESDLLWSYR